MRLREIRNDTIWINGEDVSMAFKPMKMGLRMAHLVEEGRTWDDFLEKYVRIKNTYEQLFNIPGMDMSSEEIKSDVDNLK